MSETVDRPRDNLALFALNILYYATMGISTFLSKYMGEIGLTDAQIGVLLSVPVLVGSLPQSVFQLAADRARTRRAVLALLFMFTGVFTLASNYVYAFVPLFLLLTVTAVFSVPVSGISATIALEYRQSVGKHYGPIRMTGTIGYQLGALGTGLILAGSLRGIYALTGVVLFACAGLSLLLPPVAGKQRGMKRTLPFRLLREKDVALVLFMAMLGEATSIFYVSFFGKYLGELGFGNDQIGLLTLLSVMLEIPLLLLADRWFRRMSIYAWLLVGYAMTGVRWICLSLSTSLLAIALVQTLGVAVILCFEYYPTLYLYARSPAPLRSSAQGLLGFSNFTVGRVLGGLLLGFLCDGLGIAVILRMNGVMLLALIPVLWVVCRRIVRKDGNENG